MAQWFDAYQERYADVSLQCRELCTRVAAGREALRVLREATQEYLDRARAEVERLAEGRERVRESLEAWSRYPRRFTASV